MSVEPSSPPQPPVQAPPPAAASLPVATARTRRRHLPAWLRLALVALAGAVLGAAASYLLRKVGL